ncbi:MAG: succinate dehydrogenase, cytochrome b556 subunit [Rhodospirillales bacterium]
MSPENRPSPDKRPLSPHLNIYKFRLHMFISITHRITGVGVATGLLALVYWLAAAAYGPESFARVQYVYQSWFGYLCLLGWTVCLFYHLCNGIRHLFWDIGWGFEKNQYMNSGLAVLAATFVLTAASWFIGLSG